MRDYMSNQKTRSEASMAAARTLVQLRVDASQPIDIFKIIQDQGIWLMFQPLKNLFGVYLREGDTAGIILNSKHPLSLQRFTAAHEFGHHMLRHTISLDDDVYLERAQTGTDLHEVAADAFAARFLMPLQLVNTMLVRMGLSRNPDRLTSIQVYKLALDMGVSYTAAINGLVGLDKISREVAAELRTKRPQDIKKQLGGRLLDNSRIDVWALDSGSSGKQIHPRMNDEISISLPEAPSTGYLWTMDSDMVADMTQQQPRSEASKRKEPELTLFDDEGGIATTLPLALVSNEFEANDNNNEEARFGSGGNRYLTFRTLMPGQYTLRLTNRRPWQTASPPAEVFEVHLTVSPKPTGDSENGLSLYQQSLMSGA